MPPGLMLLAVALAFVAPPAVGQQSRPPDTVVVQSGSLALRALLWRPSGAGPFPAVLFNHGSGHGRSTSSGRQDQANRIRQAEVLGPVFARHGYVFLFLFRRGAGLSAGQGTYSGDLMDREFAASGQKGQNQIQLRLLETDEMSDALAGLAFLRGRSEVDPRRVAVAGHSFGGSLTLLLAERDSTLKAAVDFAGAAKSWNGSPPLQDRLLDAVRRTTVPVLFLHAKNDYSIAPAQVLGDEMSRFGKLHRVRIYPPVGATVEEGHSFLYLSIVTWEADVFGFLDELMR